MYIRFGRIPEMSRNRGTGKEEAGVSCYSVSHEQLEDNLLVLDLAGESLDVALQMIGYTLKRRECYEIAGDLVGYGSDGEPLLTNVSVIRELGWVTQIWEDRGLCLALTQEQPAYATADDSGMPYEDEAWRTAFEDRDEELQAEIDADEEFADMEAELFEEEFDD